MAAGSYDVLAATAALKVAYSSKTILPMLNEERPFTKKLKSEIPAGARVSEGILKFNGNLHRPQNVGQTLDNGKLPAPKDRTEVQFQLTPTLFVGGFQIGEITKAAATSNKSAFNGGELRRRTEESLAELGWFIESTYTGTHGTGRRARVESDGSNNFVAASPEGVALLRENQYITVRTTDGGATVRDSCDYRYITDIDWSTRTVTYSGADQTLVAGDHVHPVVEASLGALTSYFANGLRNLVDDGTYAAALHGVTRGTPGYGDKLKSYVSENGGTLRDLTERLLIRACHQIRARSGLAPTDIWTSPGQIEKYLDFVRPDRQYTVSSKTSPQSKVTGYTDDELVHVTPNGPLRINMSFNIVPRELYLLNWNTFFHYVSKDMGWWDEGNMLKPTPYDGGYKASYMAFLAGVENWGTDFPLANGVIRDLRDPAIGDADPV